MKQLKIEPLQGYVTDTISLIGVYSKDTDFMHAWELGYNQNKNSYSVEEEHRMLIVGCMGGYQVPEKEMICQRDESISICKKMFGL